MKIKKYNHKEEYDKDIKFLRENYKKNGLMATSEI